MFAALFALLCAPLTMLSQQATPAAKILSFNLAEVGIAAGSAQTLTASFDVSGFPGGFTPTATLHYGHDYFLGPVTCTPGGASETCTAAVRFQPSLPGTRKDAIFLMDGSTRLATVLLGGVGEGPMSLLQPGAFSTSVPSSALITSGYNYIYQSVADENGTVYLLPSGNAKFIISVTRTGVVSQIPLTNPGYFAAVGIDGAGVLYLFNESKTVATYDTVQGIQGTYDIPYGGPDTDWYPGAVGADGTFYIVDQIPNNGVAYEFKPDGSTGYADTLNPGVLQPFTAAVDSAGNFFVGGYAINKITPSGVQTQVNTVGASDGLAVDAADTLYATRYHLTGGVAELPASNYSTAIASIDTKSSPLGVSLGSDGTVFVSNYVNLDIFDRSTTETIDFGEVDAGKSSTVSTASVYNGGNQPLTIAGFTLSGPGFSLDPNASKECASGTLLPPGALCLASVVFSPAHPGGYSGTITVTSNSLNGPPTTQTIQLIGTTDGSYDVLSPSPLVFPSQSPGTSKTLPVTLTNKGDSYASTIYSIATDNPVFTISQGTCTGAAVQPGASCQLQVTFSPTSVQAYSGDATIVTYVSGTAQAAQTITLPLSGSGVGPVASTPVIAPGTGSYTSSQQVIITDTTANSTIYYTIDGSAPSASSTKYTGAIAVNSNETVSAIATAAGYTQSAAASAIFTFHEAVATVTPTSLAFGNQIQGIASVAQTVTLKNTGVGTLTLTGFSITGSADFSQTNNCTGSLAAGSICTLSIGYTPTSLGGETATLTVNSDSIKAAPTVALSGTGIVQPPALSLSSLALAFGNQIVNTSSAAQSVTVTNNSTTDTVVVSNLQINALGFLIQPSTCTSPIAPGASCVLPFIFAPGAVRAYTATATFKAQASGCGGCVRNYPVDSVVLTGTGIAQPPVLKISPATLDFGNQVVNTSNTTQSVTVTNISQTDAILIGGVFSTSASALIAGSATCSSPLAPGKSCTAQVTFIPSAIQTYSGTVIFQPQVSGCGGCTRSYPAQTLAVTGTGIAQPPVLAVSPATLDFGKQIANTTSALLPVTVTNTSATDTIALTDLTIYSPDFSVNSSSCPQSLAPGASCSVYYTFSPTTFHDYDAVATIQPVPYQCGGCVRNYPYARFHLTGLGVPLPPALTVSPSFLTFGDQPVNTRSAEQFITVTNASTTDTVELNDFATGIGFDFDFNSCPGPLAPGGSCTVGYYFVPTEYKLYGGAASITAVPYICPSACASVNPTVTFDLIGTGTVPLSYLTPSSLNFTATAGTTSAPQTAILSDYREPVYTVYGISITGANADLYHQTNTCGLFLTIGAGCTITVTFTPTAAGSYPATLEVVSNDPTSPQTISLNGFAARSRYTPLIDFGTGFSADALTLTGPSTITGGALQLTSGPSSAASSAFYPTSLPTKSFDTEVSFQLLDPTAEGITFTIQGDGPNAAGTGGGGLGYQGLAKSIAVKFDLKDTAGEGIDSTGIYVNGAAPTVPAVPLASSGIDLHSGHVFMLHLTYDGTTMSISLTDTLTLAVWTTKATEDIPGIVGGDSAYFGFTAGSGTPALTPKLATLARSAITTAESQQPSTTSNILTWIYTANGQTKNPQTIGFPALTSRTYGASPIPLAATASSGLPVSYSVSGPARLSGTTLAITGAGEVRVTASQSGNASFTAAIPVTRSFTVAKAPLTVTANNLSRMAGATNPGLTYNLSGFVGGDAASAVSGTAVLTTTAVSSSPAGYYPITFSSEALTAANYSFNYVAGTLTVTSSSCQIVNYTSGFSASELSLNGGATLNGSDLELTDGGLGEARSAFFATALPTTSFTTDFTFQITDPVADGMTFTIQSNNARVIGLAGGGLGYAGIPHSIAIKVDLHNNAGEGTDSTGMYTNGAYPSTPAINLTPAGIDLHSGHIFAGHLAYANGLTRGSIRDTVTGVSASMNFPGDITRIVGNNAWFGFTAGTGAHSATQKILTWSYSGGTGCTAK